MYIGNRVTNRLGVVGPCNTGGDTLSSRAIATAVAGVLSVEKSSTSYASSCVPVFPAV